MRLLRSALLTKALVAGLILAPLPASAEDTVRVSIDHARILKIDAPAETIIIGNPSIVDVAIHDSRTLILTGRSYGVTNLVALDAAGEAIIDEEVAVTSVETASVRIYRQASRSTFSCSPMCEPTVTIGDNMGHFQESAAQFSSRESLARGAAATTSE